jgi:hypothetical protein
MSQSTNRLTKSLTDMISEDLTNNNMNNIINETNTTSNSNTFLGLTFTTWIIIILILALLGINIFTYLAKGTEETANLFNRFVEPILRWFGYTTLETTKQTVEVSATGTKAGVDIIAGSTTSAIKEVQQEIKPQGKMEKSVTQLAPVQEEIQQNHYDSDSWNLQKALDDASTSAKQGVLPDDSQSRIQASTGKAGWCYIGEDNGFRACSEIGVNDRCMSGDIFPTQAICMNPSLRL